MTITPSVAGGLCGGLAAALILRSGWRDFRINLALGGAAGLAVSAIAGERGPCIEQRGRVRVRCFCRGRHGSGPYGVPLTTRTL